jgi:hypothetical protein
MAITGMASGHENPVCSVEQGFYYKKRIHATRTGYPDYPQVSGLFKTAYPGCICSAI